MSAQEIPGRDWALERRTHAAEIERGERFRFGANWARFLSVLNEERIRVAEDSLKTMLRVDTLEGASFLDAGCGSGLFSLCAHRLGARVHSFDYDPESVACGLELKRRYFPGDDTWRLEEASVLDADYLESLGRFDVVYSWGVLHHTGDMWTGLENATIPVAPGGKLFVSIYNDQGMRSKLWRWVKKTYCGGGLGRIAMIVGAGSVIAFGQLKSDLVRGLNPLARYREYKQRRGMSAWHDVLDWLGGYPFEVATPQQIFDFYRERGFHLVGLTTNLGSGTNQFVFEREA